MRSSTFAFAFAFTLVGCAAPTAGGIVPPNVSPVEKKLGQNPNDAQVNLAMGSDAEGGGDLLRAEQYYLRAEALGVPQAEMVPRLVRVLAAAHRYDEALDRCRRRLAARPDDRATRYVVAALLVAIDRPREAERELHALVRTEPKDPQAYLALGKLYRDGNDAVRARQMFQKYLELAPNDEAAAGVRFDLADAPAPESQESP